VSPSFRSLLVQSSRITLSLLDLLLRLFVRKTVGWVGEGRTGTHQRPHRAVQSMPVVPSELRVGSLERGIPMCLGLLDAAIVGGVLISVDTL